MKLEGEGKLLRIFIGEIDRVDHKPLYEALVLKAREMGLAGATVLRGIESYGAGSRVLHTAKILRLSEDLPIIVEIVDTEENIDAFVKTADELLERAGCGGLMTEERAHIIHYRAGK
jgi:PII-like signaling protein